MKTINNWFNSFIRWVALSSENPSQASLSVKATLVLAIPYIMQAQGLLHVSYADNATLTLLVNDVTGFIYSFLGIVGASMLIWGLFRKVMNTIGGSNVVINGIAPLPGTVYSQPVPTVDVSTAIPGATLPPQG